MLSLRPVDFYKIQHWFVDYQKRSHDFEMPSDEADFIGIFQGEELIGYFICLCPDKQVVEIRQGYLKKEARHKNNSKIAMHLLEKLVKEKGFKKIVLGTYRANRSYIKFMEQLGFNITSIEFAKEVTNG